jgi:2-keto-4-pentenoate hydratase/2-oxohepta-3-ene-1,7-dioic acid hydratase in catechol pathway
MDQIADPKSIHFELKKNGETVQKGDTADVIFSFEDIIVYVSKFFKLQMGDIIYTGTPAGVGPVKVGDTLEGFIELNSGNKQFLTCEIK